MSPEELKKYECPKHGQNGNPDCSICWENLEKLLGDMGKLHGQNVYMSGDNPINRIKNDD